MTTNTAAFYMYPPGEHEGSTSLSKNAPSLIPESAPAILYGDGTPDGDRAPFTSVNKGSLYMQMDATDDNVHVWTKVDEGGADADWKEIGLSVARSKTFNIDNGSGTTDDDIILVPDRAIMIVDAKRVYTEATDTSGAASATTAIGTAVAGQQIVASVACSVSKAVGSADDLTIVSGAVSADGMVAVRHTGIASTEAGQYFVQITFF